MSDTCPQCNHAVSRILGAVRLSCTFCGWVQATADLQPVPEMGPSLAPEAPETEGLITDVSRIPHVPRNFYTPPPDHRPPPFGSFSQEWPSTLRYPLQGKGRGMLMAGMVTFALMGLATGVSAMLAPMLALVTFGYLGAYMIKIINSTACFDREPPDWPNFSNVWDDIITPALEIIGVSLISYGPAILALYYQQWILAGLLVLGGLFYWPMALLAVAINGTVIAALPLFVLPAILRVFPAYVMAFLVLLGITLVTGVLNFFVGSMPVIGGLLTGGVGLYTLMMEMRLIGLVFATHQDQLGWISAR